MPDEIDLTAELDAADALVLHDVTTVTEWGVCYAPGMVGQRPQRGGAVDTDPTAPDRRRITPDERGTHIDQALEALGGEDTEFVLTVKDKDTSAGAFAAVLLSCRYQHCEWGESVGEMELWEFVADAREHWETVHAGPPEDSSGEKG
jgi:hypothetical protein